MKSFNEWLESSINAPEKNAHQSIIYPDFQGIDEAQSPQGNQKTLDVSYCIGNEPGKDYQFFMNTKKDYINQMIKDVKAKGINAVPNVLAIPHPLIKNKYLVIDGNHRLGAFKIAGIPKINATIVNPEDVLLAVPNTKYKEGVVPETMTIQDVLTKGFGPMYFNTKDLLIPKKQTN